MLHVTNGDLVVALLEASRLPGDRLAWADVLHEGPVRAGLSDGELRAERAGFLAAAGWPHEEVLAQLERRDRRLAEAAGHEEIVLWFEADLYDQLQILQILDRLEPNGAELICIGGYLGRLEPPELPPLFAQREPVTRQQVDLARRAWGAFREPDPRALDGLRGDRLTPLPFLADALTRLLEELPWTTDGLSRSERSLLAPLHRDPRSGADLFRAHMAAEERMFLGDTWAFDRLEHLAAGRRPLLSRRAGLYELTEDGGAVLAGELDAVDLNGIDRWLGGTHVRTPDAVWRWDPSTPGVASPG